MEIKKIIPIFADGNKTIRIMIRIVTLNTNRSEYDIRDAAARSMTVRQFIDELECNYNEGDKIVFSNDNGYTYGYIGAGYIDAHRVETHEEEDLRENMEELQEELTELQSEYEDSDDDEDRMSDEEYREEREKLFRTHGVTEEEYDKFNF